MTLSTADAATEPRSTGRRYWQSFLLLVCCVAVMFALHSRYLDEGFLLDDNGFEERFRHYTALDVLRCFTPTAIHWYYRPVFILWFALFHALWPHNAWAMHAGSLALAGLNTFLIALLARRLTKAWWPAVVVAMVFDCASDSVEALWWISAASTLLAMFFSLVSIHLWLTMRESGSKWAYAGSMASMALAMCSKEDAALLPVALIAVDVCLRRR